MRSGNWSTSKVRVPHARVLVNGVERPVKAVEVEAEIPSALPGQAGGTGGMMATTGSVEWATEEPVNGRVSTPWTDADLPKRGDAVEIYAGDGEGNEYRIFTGIANGTPGSFRDPSRVTQVIDRTGELKRPFSMDALSWTMPPSQQDVYDQRRRMIGLNAQYITDRILRECGFYTTPPLDGFCVASAPLVGSAWPDRGELTDSYLTSDNYGAGRENPLWSYDYTRGALATKDLVALYRTDQAVYSGLISQSRPLNISMQVGTWVVESGYVAAAWYGSTRQIRLAVTSSRQLAVQYRDASNTVINWLTMNESEAPGYKAATARIELNSTGGSFIVRLRTDTGVEKRYAVIVPDGYLTSNPVDQMWVYAPNTRLGGAMVSFTSLEWTYLSHTQGAWMSAPLTYRDLRAVPALESTDSLELLKRQSEAEGSAMWIDEDGIFQWRAKDVFPLGDPALTLTAAEHLKDVVFRDDGEDVRRRVVATYRRAATSSAQDYSIVAYEGHSDELDIGDTKEQWIKPDDDTDWIMVDTAHETIVGSGGTGPMNTGRGTFQGFKAIDANGDEMLDNTGFTRTLNFTSISPRAYLSEITVTATPAGVDHVVTATLDNTALKSRYRNVGLPLVRCKGLVSWTDATYSSGYTGPSWAEDLEHDCSWFVQDPTEVTKLVDSLAAKLANPEPVIESVDIIPDARIQRGDKVTIQDETKTGLRITGVVTGFRHRIVKRRHTMSLRMVVTAVEIGGLRLTSFESQHAGLTVAELETKYAGETVTGMESDTSRA